MAITHVTLGPILARGRAGVTLPVEASQPRDKQKFVPAASAASSIVAQEGDFWHVSTDTAVWLKFGATPIAADGDTHFLPAGASRSFSAVAGEKIAVMAA